MTPAKKPRSGAICSKGAEYNSVLTSLKATTLWPVLLQAYEQKETVVNDMLEKAGGFIKGGQYNNRLCGSGHCEQNTNWGSAVAIVIKLHTAECLKPPLGEQQYERLLVDYGCGTMNVLFAAVILTGADVIGFEHSRHIAADANKRCRELQSLGLGLAGQSQRKRLGWKHTKPRIQCLWIDICQLTNWHFGGNETGVLQPVTAKATHVWICSKAFSPESFCYMLTGILLSERSLLALCIGSSSFIQAIWTHMPLSILEHCQLQSQGRASLSYIASPEHFSVTTLHWCVELNAQLAVKVLDQLQTLVPSPTQGQIGYGQQLAKSESAAKACKLIGHHLTALLPDRIYRNRTPLALLERLHVEDHLRRLARSVQNDIAAGSEAPGEENLDLSTRVSSLLVCLPKCPNSGEGSLDLLLTGVRTKDRVPLRFMDYGSVEHNCGFQAMADFLGIDRLLGGGTSPDSKGVSYLRHLCSVLHSMLDAFGRLNDCLIEDYIRPLPYFHVAQHGPNTVFKSLTGPKLQTGDMDKLALTLELLESAFRKNRNKISTSVVVGDEGVDARAARSCLNQAGLLEQRMVLLMAMLIGFRAHICCSFRTSHSCEAESYTGLNIMHHASLTLSPKAADMAFRLYTLVHDQILTQWPGEFDCLSGLPLYLRTLHRSAGTSHGQTQLGFSVSDPQTLCMFLVGQHYVRVMVNHPEAVPTPTGTPVTGSGLQTPIAQRRQICALLPPLPQPEGPERPLVELSPDSFRVTRIQGIGDALRTAAAVRFATPHLLEGPEGPSLVCRDRGAFKSYTCKVTPNDTSTTASHMVELTGAVLAALGICCDKATDQPTRLRSVSATAAGSVQPIGSSNWSLLCRSITVAFDISASQPEGSGTGSPRFILLDPPRLSLPLTTQQSPFWRLMVLLPSASDPSQGDQHPPLYVTVPGSSPMHERSFYAFRCPVDTVAFRPVRSDCQVMRMLPQSLIGHTILIADMDNAWSPTHNWAAIGSTFRTVPELLQTSVMQHEPGCAASLAPNAHPAMWSLCQLQVDQITFVNHTLPALAKRLNPATSDMEANDDAILYGMQSIWWSWQLARSHHLTEVKSQWPGLAKTATIGTYAASHFRATGRIAKQLLEVCKLEHVQYVFIPLHFESDHHWALLQYNTTGTEHLLLDSIQSAARVDWTRAFCSKLDGHTAVQHNGHMATVISTGQNGDCIHQSLTDRCSCGWIVLLHFARQLAEVDKLPTAHISLKPLSGSNCNLQYAEAIKQMKTLLLQSISYQTQFDISSVALVPPLARLVHPRSGQ